MPPERAISNLELPDNEPLRWLFDSRVELVSRDFVLDTMVNTRHLRVRSKMSAEICTLHWSCFGEAPTRDLDKLRAGSCENFHVTQAFHARHFRLPILVECCHKVRDLSYKRVLL
jgi:hypothetical protein